MPPNTETAPGRIIPESVHKVGLPSRGAGLSVEQTQRVASLGPKVMSMQEWAERNGIHKKLAGKQITQRHADQLLKAYETYRTRTTQQQDRNFRQKDSNRRFKAGREDAKFRKLSREFGMLQKTLIDIRKAQEKGTDDPGKTILKNLELIDKALEMGVLSESEGKIAIVSQAPEVRDFFSKLIQSVMGASAQATGNSTVDESVIPKEDTRVNGKRPIEADTASQLGLNLPPGRTITNTETGQSFHVEPMMPLPPKPKVSPLRTGELDRQP